MTPKEYAENVEGWERIHLGCIFTLTKGRVYWCIMGPPLTAWQKASTKNLGGAKSGTPWSRFTAPWLCASCVISFLLMMECTDHSSETAVFEEDLKTSVLEHQLAIIFTTNKGRQTNHYTHNGLLLALSVFLGHQLYEAVEWSKSIINIRFRTECPHNCSGCALIAGGWLVKPDRRYKTSNAP